MWRGGAGAPPPPPPPPTPPRTHTRPPPPTGAGAEAARALGAAYRQEVPLDGACRLFGRDAVAFKSFEHMLDDAQSKQAAWALLKKLPRFGGR